MSWRLVFAVLGCLAVAACADGAKRSGDDGRFSGAYGGVSGGADFGGFR